MRSHSHGGAVLAALSLAMLPGVAGCAALSSDRTDIVVTTNILGDITSNVLGDEADVSVLMPPNADPHSFGVSAQEAAEMAEAELLIYNGLGLEEGVLHNVEAAAEAGVPTLEVGAAIDPIDYAEGETAGEDDPHFWTDPLRVATAVDAIADAVIDTGGVDEEVVRDNAEDYQSRLEDLHEDLTEQFAAIPSEQRALITNHHVFGYLAERYDFDVIGAVFPSGTTLASPSSSDLQSLTDAIEEAGVGAVFADSSQNDRLAQVLADEADVHVEVISLYSESLTEADGGAPTYLAMARANAEAITAGLTATP
ncbi:zinc ABC transporter substrate-binding protein AztC [Spiractinospora alimapuensis]|uniref:zinc ABC transporter substrate-binding protein AztC n=1 Tax=Spiractinospora alimapuensis TaxID=2820884 RepID=UPI001F2E23A4|nr:zinc ABC transporter substrate-binding protein AztC [Spiractinospora alimapuensis]